MSKLWRSLLVSLVLGLGSLYLVLPETFQLETLWALTQLGAPQLALLLGVLALRWLVGGGRTVLLTRLGGTPLSLSQGVRAYVVGLFASVITPAGGGAAVGLSWLLTRYGVPLQHAVLTSVLITVLDMTFFAWSVPAAFLYLSNVGTALPLAGLGWFVGLFSAAILTLSFLMIFRLAWLTGSVRALCRLPGLRRYQERIGHFLVDLEAASRAFARVPWHVHLGLHAYTALFWAVSFGFLNVAAFALGLGVPQLELLSLHTLIHAFAFLIPTPGASGYMEGALSLALAGRADPQMISGTVIVWRSLSYYLYFVLGPLISGRALMKGALPSKPKVPGQAN